ncbi:MAG: MerC domain-containing protein [Sediminicola sp.]
MHKKTGRFQHGTTGGGTLGLKNADLDLLGLGSSLICAIHCAAIPILLSFSSLNALHFLANPYIEWTFIGIGILFVLISLWPSYKKVHHRTRPLYVAASGFGFIAMGRLDLNEIWEISNTVLGAAMVATAHYINWKLTGGPVHHHH